MSIYTAIIQVHSWSFRFTLPVQYTGSWLQVQLFQHQRMVQNLDADGEEGGTESSSSFGMPSRTWSFGKQENTLQRKRISRLD